MKTSTLPFTQGGRTDMLIAGIKGMLSGRIIGVSDFG